MSAIDSAPVSSTRSPTSADGEYHLVQVVRRTGEIKRVPRGVTPPAELMLKDNEQILSLELKDHSWYDHPDRKTVDWSWTALIAVHL